MMTRFTHHAVTSFVILSLCAAVGHAQERGGLRDRIELKTDIAYAGTENPKQRLDLLLPRERVGEGPLPVVAFVHGGGWRNGDKRVGIGRLAPLVSTGRFAGVSIGYRLSGEATWPAQIHDCKAAIRWIRANAEKHGLDGEKIAVWGTSAGGHLVAMLGTTGDVKELEGELGPNLGHSSRVTCVVDYFGPTDFLTMNDHPSRIDHDAANSPESLLIGGPIQRNQEKAKAAAPLTYVTKDDAPHLVAHGSEDPLVPFPQSEALAKSLVAAGVECTLIRMEGGGHGFKNEELDRRVRAFLDRHLHGMKVEVSSKPIAVEARRRRP